MAWFIILAVITAGLALGLPPDPHTLHELHISGVAYRIAVLALLIPYGVIWYAAFYAFSKLREYARTIQGFEDGKAFRSITVGMGVLAFGLIVPTAVSLVMQSITGYHPGFRPVSAIVTNHLGILTAVVAFTYINNGTHVLIRLGKNRPGLADIRLFALLFITLATVFTYLVTNYHLQNNGYYLNTPLLITTLIIPSLFAWLVALLGAYEIWLYAKTAKGVLYRQALRRFSYGIVAAIAGSVASQFVANTFVAGEVHHSIEALLLVDYAFLAVIALGLILMALGTRKLQKIEEV